MISFNIEKHDELIAGDQVLSINEYSFDNDHCFTNKQVIEKLLNSEPDLFWTLTDAQKKRKRPTLPLPFILITPPGPTVTLDRYVALNKKETLIALTDFLNYPYWGSDKDDFEILLNLYLQLTEHVTTNEFYVGKELFSNAKPEWKTSDDTSSYEFNIIYIDRPSRKLGISIWVYD